MSEGCTEVYSSLCLFRNMPCLLNTTTYSVNSFVDMNMTEVPKDLLH